MAGLGGAGADGGEGHVPHVTGQLVVWPYVLLYRVQPGSFWAHQAHVYVPRPKADHVELSAHDCSARRAPAGGGADGTSRGPQSAQSVPREQ